MADSTPAATEIALQRLVTIYVVAGLLLLLLPGPFLGVWNLDQHSASAAASKACRHRA